MNHARDNGVKLMEAVLGFCVVFLDFVRAEGREDLMPLVGTFMEELLAGIEGQR